MRARRKCEQESASMDVGDVDGMLEAAAKVRPAHPAWRGLPS